MGKGRLWWRMCQFLSLLCHDNHDENLKCYIIFSFLFQFYFTNVSFPFLLEVVPIKCMLIHQYKNDLIFFIKFNTFFSSLQHFVICDFYINILYFSLISSLISIVLQLYFLCLCNKDAWSYRCGVQKSRHARRQKRDQ